MVKNCLPTQETQETQETGIRSLVREESLEEEIYYRKLASMRFAVGAAMSYGEVSGTSRHVVDAVEVVHAVLVGDVGLTT